MPSHLKKVTVYLRADEEAKLNTLTAATGRSTNDLLHAAIGQLASERLPTDWLKAYPQLEQFSRQEFAESKRRWINRILEGQRRSVDLNKHMVLRDPDPSWWFPRAINMVTELVQHYHDLETSVRREYGRYIDN